MAENNIPESNNFKHLSNSDEQNIDQAFQKSEDALLLEGLNRTYTERFYFATRLYKVQKLMEKARITHALNIPSHQ